jgi:hypothetical protein
MKIQIDAAKVAEELAINGIVNSYTINRERVIKLVDEEIDSNHIKIIQSHYRSKYDYYFKILTNHAL